MKAEFNKIFKLFEELEEAGESATLTISSKGGISSIKLLLESPQSLPTTGTTTTPLPPVPGRRRRLRGAAARARRRQRAADHQASLAQAATSVPLVPPCRPLHILPSPPTASGRRRVMSVGRPDMPSFSSLNLDGNPPVPPSSLPTNPWIPCFDDCDIKDDHCEVCFRCCLICIEHGGCICYSVINQPNPDCSQCGQQLELGLDLGNLSK